VLAVAGVALVLVAQAQMGSSWRIGVDEGEQTALVTDGLFRHVRNPIFTGMGPVAAGTMLMVPTPAALLALACLVVALEIQIRVVEEPYLRRTHGAAYATYTAGSGRFLPKVRGMPAGRRSGRTSGPVLPGPWQYPLDGRDNSLGTRVMPADHGLTCNPARSYMSAGDRC
jgi:hypothetical protein